MSVELDPHQITALKELKNGSVLKGGVGTGKSRTALAYFFVNVCDGRIRFNGTGEYKAPTKPKDLYIITTAKKRDKLEWEGEAADFALSTDPAHSVGGIKVTVDSWNNIVNYVDIKNSFFIFDEQRLVGSGAWVKSFLKIAKQNEWILLSATPGDTWMDYCPVFIANGFYKNRTEFIHTHVVYNNFTKFPKIDRYIETGKLEKYRKRILVDMPYKRHTVRHVLNVPVDYSENLYEIATKKRWNPFTDEPIKDISEYCAVVRRIVNTDVSRLGELMKLVEKHPRMIVFYNFNYELDMLRPLATTLNIPVTEWNGHKHEEIPATDRWIYLVQYTAGAEGWNCVSTDTVVFWSLNYSYRIMEQCKGRIDRMNTKFVDLWYYVLRSKSQIDNAIVHSLATKKDFNEKKYFGKWE